MEKKGSTDFPFCPWKGGGGGREEEGGVTGALKGTYTYSHKGILRVGPY